MFFKIKQFFKLIKFELIRVTRNKVVFSLLICFSLALFLALSFVQNNSANYSIAVFTDGAKLEETEVFQLIDEHLKTDNILIVKNKSEGINKVKNHQVTFFICLDTGEEKDETTAVFYYDQSSSVGRAVVSGLTDAKNEYAYKALNEFLGRYGIVMNKTHFEQVTFESANNNTVTIKQMTFSMEVACVLALVLMLGMANSLARDNETQVSKNISYIPIGANRYLLTKTIPYVVLGVLEIIVMYVLGILLRPAICREQI